MSKRIILEGKKIGRLNVISYIPAKPHGKYLCQCECGTQLEIQGLHLRTGHTSSCGCYKKEVTSAVKSTHGMTATKIHVVWRGMRQRCNDPKASSYKNYGGRGIKVCERWDRFENFLADMGVPEEGQTIDRRDNMGDYTPENCRWASLYEQGNNRRNNTLVTFEGRTQTVTEWSRELGHPRMQTLWKQLFVLNWPEERALAKLSKAALTAVH